MFASCAYLPHSWCMTMARSDSEDSERAHRVWRESTPNSPLSLSEYRFVQLAECTDTGEFTVAEPFKLFVGRHGKTGQSYSSPLPGSTSKFLAFFKLSTLSKWFPFCFDSVSTNLTLIIGENPAKTTPQKFGYPGFYIPSRHQDNKMDYIPSMPYSHRCFLQGFTQTRNSCHYSQCAVSHRAESLSSLREGEVFMVLSDLRSIISVPSLDEHDSRVRLFRAFLEASLTDRLRSGDTSF